MRNPILILALMLCTAFSSFAQLNFYNGTTLTDIDMPQADALVDYDVKYVNSSSEPVYVIWGLKEVFTSTGWEYSFCDNGLCYLPPIPAGGQAQPTAPGDTAFFKLTLNNYDNSGYGKVHLTVRIEGIEDYEEEVIIWAATYGVTVGVDESTFGAQKLEVYPNPATDEITIRHSGEGVIIYNMSGQEMERGGLRTDEVVSLTDWPDGSYVIYDPNTGERKIIQKQ